ncbi:MAG: hypothetical protein QM214_01655 [Bacillota bacterium]|jgi:hypothetical protein|nr:hypothetical protein [Bacillota bacterium]
MGGTEIFFMLWAWKNIIKAVIYAVYYFSIEEEEREAKKIILKD